MPTYLCHGFRWQRRSVRVYVILQNLDDASPEWIIPARSSRCILKSFYEVFDFLPYCSPKLGSDTPPPEGNREGSTSTKDRSQSRGRGRSQSQSTGQSRSQSRATQHQPLPPVPGIADDSSSSSAASSAEDEFSAQSWSAIKLLEEYDPNDLSAVSRPYAYVADYAVRIDLSCSIVDEIARYEQQQLQSSFPAISIPSRNSPVKGAGWFEQLRDQLQRGEEIRWYVVVNNDEVRDWPDEPPEPEGTALPEQGDPYQSVQQYQQQQQYQYPYQPQPGRPLPTREQRQHHAQYIHQQLIFEGSDRERGQGQGQGPEQGQQLVLEGSDQQRKQEQEQSSEWKKEQELLRERTRVRQQQDRLQKEQELRREQERLWRRQKERELERERQLKREQEENRKREEKERQQQQQKARLNGMDTDSKPPMVPEKDYFFPRPPTASTKANAPPLKPKTSFDAGASVRPKTPGSKGSGLRRLFGRAKADVGS
jgi:hypothetical protein